MGRAELAGGDRVSGEQAVQGAAARDDGPGREIGVGEIRFELRHEHRRSRREIVRVHHLEQRLREARELGVELELHARGHEADAFEQALDVRIGHLQPVHPQPRRNARKLLRELRAHLAQMLQLEVVVLKEPGVHVLYTTREEGMRSAISTLPVSRSISVRTSSSSGTGCAQR